MRGLLKTLSPLRRGLMQLLRVATLTRVNDAKTIQMVQLETLSGEVIEVPRIQDYGLTSVPLQEAKGVVAAIGGNTNGYVVIKMDDHRYRLVNLEPGEVALYDDQGQFVHLKRNGHMHAKALTKLTVDSPLTVFTGDVQALGEITDRLNTGGISMHDMRTTYDGHNHPGDSGGNTGTPNQEMS